MGIFKTAKTAINFYYWLSIEKDVENCTNNYLRGKY